MQNDDLGKIVNEVDNVADFISFASPVAGVAVKFATSVVSKFLHSDDEALQGLGGLNAIADLMVKIANGEIDKNALYKLSDELKNISIALGKFNKLIT